MLIGINHLGEFAAYKGELKPMAISFISVLLFCFGFTGELTFTAAGLPFKFSFIFRPARGLSGGLIITAADYASGINRVFIKPG